MIKVTKGYPWCDFDENLSKKLKYVTSKRLCETTRSLDLSHFYCDPYLVDNYFCALFIPKIFFTIMNFAYDFMPDLEILYLEKNNLRLTKNICRGISKFSKLKVIYLNNNIVSNFFFCIIALKYLLLNYRISNDNGEYYFYLDKRY